MPGQPAYKAAFAVSALRSVVLTMRATPPQLTAILADTGLTEAGLMQGEGYLSWPEVHQLVSNILHLAPQAGLALDSGFRVIPTLHGPMGIAAMSCDTLGDAMHTFSKYMATRSQVLEAEIQEVGDWSHMNFRLLPEDDAVSRFLMEAIVASCFACTEFLLGEKLSGLHIRFAWPAPADTAVFARVFHGNDVVFDAAQTAIWLPVRYMQHALLSRDRQMRAIAEQQCDAIRDSLRRQGSFGEIVLQHLRAEEGAMPALAQMAITLNLSPRTVIRRLKDEGTRYQDLADSEASRRAAFLLGLPGATVAAVAAQLGYAEPASFRRAFRRWFGVTPSEFRA